MLNKEKTILFLFLTLGFVTIAQAAVKAPAQSLSNIKVDIQSDTRRSYQSLVNASELEVDGNSIASDRRIQADIVNLIENKYRKYNINIEVSEGNVVLKGFLQNDEVKQDIENDVKSIHGVKSIDNLLKIQGRK